MKEGRKEEVEKNNRRMNKRNMRERRTKKKGLRKHCSKRGGGNGRKRGDKEIAEER